MTEHQEHVDIPLAGQLHRAMREFVARAARRRNLTSVLHVGRPALEQVSVPDRDWYDVSTRTDLVTRALDGLVTERPLVWLTRSGDLTTTDSDLAWCNAAMAAFARHDLPLDGVFLLTRKGWADLASEERHEWYRVRPARYVD